MASTDFVLLEQREIIDLLIGEPRTESPLPYMRGSDIKSLGLKFNCLPSYEKNSGKMEPSRWVIMTDIMKKSVANSSTTQIIDYLVSSFHLRSTIEERSDDGDSAPFDIETVRQKIETEFLVKVNDQLRYSNKRMVRNGTTFEIYPLDIEPEIRVATTRFDIGHVKELLTNAQRDLLIGDFDSVLTKSRTILEETFMQILKDNRVDFKNNGKIGQMRNKVVATLGMRPNDEWHPRIKEFISKLNGLVDSITELRDNDSDSHASLKRLKIKEAEAELIINSAANIAIYYLRVNERQKQMD